MSYANLNFLRYSFKLNFKKFKTMAAIIALLTRTLGIISSPEDATPWCTFIEQNAGILSIRRRYRLDIDTH